MTGAAATALLQAVHVMAAAIAAGALIFPLLVVPAGPEGVVRGLKRLVLWSLAVAVAASALWLWAVASGMSGLGPFDPALEGAAIRVLADTNYGAVWLWRLGAAAGIALLLAIPRRRPDGWPSVAAAILAVGYLASVAAMGHAAAALDSSIEIPTLALHIAGAGIWFGVAVALRSVLATGSDPDFLVRATRRAGDLAALMVTLLAFAGLLTPILRIPQPAAALTSRYVVLLVLKFLLLGAALGIAAVNRWRVLPHLAGARHDDAQRMLARNLTIEIILIAAALLAAGWLAVTAPSAG